MKVNKGHLWLGREWKEALRLSLSTSDCGIEPIYRYDSSALLDNTKVIIGYQIYGYGNNRKYRTRVPKKLNPFVEKLLKSEV